MRIYTAEQTAQCLPYVELARSLASMLRTERAGAARAPRRMVVPLGGENALLLMPATDDRLAVTKLVTVHPGNPDRGLPTIQAELLVIDAATGERLGLLDGQTVTARRTAALSLLAAQHLAPRPAGPMLIIGAGAQARAHLEAFREGLRVAEAYIASRTPMRAEALAEYGQCLGVRTRVVDHPTEILDQVTVIITATTSSTPVLPETVRQDAFIAAVGAFRLDMAELPAALIHRARLYVDTLDGARAEAGDLIQANVDWRRVTSLGEALDEPRPLQGLVVFKSVGHALWDLAAARLVFGT
ncbi:MAG: delta(1)-pyrroline-2-carboxylate reductase family protein [Acidobacteria bacterium]|nr:MAG: delta(1)-pyrroline-2-carboxylate reductase family protein [Acidobacteriota bacterium]